MRALTMACGMKEIRLGGGRRRPVQVAGGKEELQKHTEAKSYKEEGVKKKDPQVINYDHVYEVSTERIAHKGQVSTLVLLNLYAFIFLLFF